MTTVKNVTEETKKLKSLMGFLVPIKLTTKTEVDKDLHTLKVNCKGKRTVGKANKGINIEKNGRFKKIKIKKKEK